MSEKIYALIIDDHAVVREGVARSLEINNKFTVFQAASVKEGRAAIALHNPDLIVVDLNLPDGNGLEIVQWVRTLNQSVAIVVLSLSEEDAFVIAAMKSGASSFVNKSEPLHVLMAQINLALQAPQIFSSSAIATALIRESENFGLSQRELQILSQLHRGEGLKELAARFFIAESTLKKHLSTIYQKLSVSNRVQAIAIARQAGLLK
jgi:DNA-binding NarL/FixJ family response regulator